MGNFDGRKMVELNLNVGPVYSGEPALRKVCMAVLLLCATAVALSCEGIGGGVTSDLEELIHER